MAGACSTLCHAPPAWVEDERNRFYNLNVGGLVTYKATDGPSLPANYASRPQHPLAYLKGSCQLVAGLVWTLETAVHTDSKQQHPVHPGSDPLLLAYQSHRADTDRSRPTAENGPAENASKHFLD